MAPFRNLLVGIDLTWCDRFTVESLPPIVQDVLRRAVWLAQKTGARLTLLAALNLTAEVFNLLAEEHRLALSGSIEKNAGDVLAELVRRANAAGVPASGVFVHGRGWLELIRQVQRGQHDLVLVGTRNFTGIRRALLGNTALKLVRRCPCPVWVSRPQPYDRPLNVLVASDLQPVSETALRLAVCLGQAADATLHLLHVVEYPFYHLAITFLPDRIGPESERAACARAREVLNEQLERSGARALARPVQVHLVDRAGDRADEAILQFIAEHRIDLLVLGSIGRGGVPGITIGNTAERLLPDVSCSVLAVKPPDFICPVQLPGSLSPGNREEET
jgi:universal stress protein E